MEYYFQTGRIFGEHYKNSPATRIEGDSRNNTRTSHRRHPGRRHLEDRHRSYFPDALECDGSSTLTIGDSASGSAAGGLECDCSPSSTDLALALVSMSGSLEEFILFLSL
ncbi:hypothetical protein R5R35_003514 [Gryllus longicercus]|uniref:Uncharacterized protein n=1 Tax=Gryllus longicercus TaxID=2509291 RepID=A0AAN9VUV3_9ORTH